MNEKVFTAYDGKTISYREWISEKPKGLLQISHGMAESSDRYDAFAKYMAENGYIVFADDHRGHGHTDNCTGYADGDMFFDTLKDMAQLTDIYKSKYPDLPIVLFGHSYGSFLTQAYIEKYSTLIDGAVIGGSARFSSALIPVGKTLSAIGCLFGKKRPAKLIANLTFGSYNKKFKTGTFISSIDSECQRYKESWDCDYVVSYNFYRSFFKGLSTLYKKKNYDNIDRGLPILLLAGDCDPVGDMGQTVKKLHSFYADKVGVSDIAIKLYNGVRHEYLNDTSRDEAYNDIREFADKVVNGQ